MSQSLSIIVVERDREGALRIVDGLREAGDHEITVVAKATALPRTTAMDQNHRVADIAQQLVMAAGWPDDCGQHCSCRQDARSRASVRLRRCLGRWHRFARRDRHPLRVGLPFPFSTHAELVWHWPGASGFTDGLSVRTVPPPMMADALAARPGRGRPAGHWRAKAGAVAPSGGWTKVKTGAQRRKSLRARSI